MNSLKFHLLKISNVLHMEEHRPIWPVLYPSFLLENTIAKEVHSIQADLSDLPNKPVLHGFTPQSPVDLASMAVLTERMGSLSREMTSSLKSFAEAVKASVVTPQYPLPTSPKAKISQPALKGNSLPQVVIRHQGHIDPTICLSFIGLITKINSSLHNHLKHLHIRMVGMKWTSSSNLVVHT